MRTKADITDAVVGMPLTVGGFWSRDAHGGIPTLFQGRHVQYAFQTRVAIRAACDVLGLQAGDEVLAPAYNCGSELDPLMHAGAKVRLYPVAENLQVDPDRIEPLITAHTRAVYVTHYFGIIQPCLAELRALCDRYGLRLIEDCALSLLSGASPVEGYIGDVSVFCFHKFLPVLEGGALIINAPGLARINLFQRPPPRGTVKKKLARALIVNALGSSRTQKLLRMMRGKAFIADLTAEDADVMVDIPSHYYFDPALQGMRISLWAARSLRGVSVSEVISARRANWNRYREQLDGMRGVRMLTPDLLPQTCPLNMPIMVADRDRVAQKLQARGIGVTPWWAGFSRHVDWTGQEEAIMLKNSVVALPLHQFLSDEHVDYIVSELAKLV